MFDLLEHGLPGRSSGYLYAGERTVLVDTGSFRCLPQILSALEVLGADPDDLDYVLLTHAHLDHAGGAGQLAEIATNAVFVAHPRAARHLVEPARLIAGTQAVYGERYSTLFGEVKPIPSHRLLIRGDGDTLDVGDRTLVFYDTPGHARHHFCVHDPVRRAIFSGDALGIRYVKAFTGEQHEFILPSSSPTDFNPADLRQTVERMAALDAEVVYHAHFGPSTAGDAFAAMRSEGDAFARVAELAWQPDLTTDAMSAALTRHVNERLATQGHPELNARHIGDDLWLDAMGLIHYERARRSRSHPTSDKPSI